MTTEWKQLLTNLDATNFGLSRSGSCTNLVSGVSNFRAPLVNLNVMPDEAYFSMLILKCPLVVGGGSGWRGCWVGRGGERRREEEKESDGSSGSGRALLVEEEPTAPEVTWGLREGWGGERDRVKQSRASPLSHDMGRER